MADTGKNAITSLDGTGAQTTFAVGFAFLADAHLQVVVDSVTQTIVTDYVVAENGTDIEFTSGSIPASGTDNVVITRVTPHSSLFVTFTDSAPITAANLQNALLQSIYYTEEVQDTI
jgi:hypothetical protein